MMLEVVAGVIWNQGRFLASRRRKGTHAGLWEFPGGKIESGETRRQALRRELQEELDITPGHASLWRITEYAYPEVDVRLHLYHVYRFSGEPRPVEGQTIRWLTVDEARAYPFLEANRPLLDALHEPACSLCREPQCLFLPCFSAFDFPAPDWCSALS